MPRYGSGDHSKPAIKHKADELTLYTGKIIDFGDKPAMERLVVGLRARGFEARLGKNGRMWYTLVWQNDAPAVDRLRAAHY